MKKYTHVIWDWNGTLLNDVDWCLRVINKMLGSRSLKTLDGLSGYYSVFGFPIVDYYIRAGFDFGKETFEELAAEYISIYSSGDKENCLLYENATYVLEELSRRGVTQTVLSASEKSFLNAQIDNYGILGYFDEILGISDIYAKGKIDIGLDYISGRNVQDAVIIGDTVHDYEVSRALGVDCVLISRGHQSKERLLDCGVRVLDDIAETLEL